MKVDVGGGFVVHSSAMSLPLSIVGVDLFPLLLPPGVGANKAGPFKTVIASWISECRRCS